MKRNVRRVRWARKLTVVVAAAPLFQLAQCESFYLQVFANTVNQLPSTIFSIMQSIALSPIQLLLGGGLNQTI